MRSSTYLKSSVLCISICISWKQARQGAWEYSQIFAEASSMAKQNYPHAVELDNNSILQIIQTRKNNWRSDEYICIGEYTCTDTYARSIRVKRACLVYCNSVSLRMELIYTALRASHVERPSRGLRYQQNYKIQIGNFLSRSHDLRWLTGLLFRTSTPVVKKQRYFALRRVYSSRVESIRSSEKFLSFREVIIDEQRFLFYIILSN